MFRLLDLIALPSPVRVLDLGARKVAGHEVDYEVLIDLGVCEIIAFDALPDGVKTLQNSHPDCNRIHSFPRAVGDGEVHTLYVCKAESRSSLFPPNLTLCNEFDGFAETLEVKRETRVATVRLDDVGEIGDIDLIKSDIQASELAAIQGGSLTFAKASVVEIEVEFVPQYLNQPLFSDIDGLLRQLGFMFHTFLSYGSRPLRNSGIPAEGRKGFKQWLWANALYVKEFEKFRALPANKLLKAAVILHEVYRSYDFALFALRCFDQKSDTDISGNYSKLLQEHLFER